MEDFFVKLFIPLNFSKKFSFLEGIYYSFSHIFLIIFFSFLRFMRMFNSPKTPDLLLFGELPFISSQPYP